MILESEVIADALHNWSLNLSLTLETLYRSWYLRAQCKCMSAYCSYTLLVVTELDH
jgi:hypothetical protein